MMGLGIVSGSAAGSGAAEANIFAAVAGGYFYDVELAQGATVRTVLKSSFTITMDITKWSGAYWFGCGN